MGSPPNGKNGVVNEALAAIAVGVREVNLPPLSIRWYEKEYILYGSTMHVNPYVVRKAATNI